MTALEIRGRKYDHFREKIANSTVTRYFNKFNPIY